MKNPKYTFCKEFYFQHNYGQIFQMTTSLLWRHLFMEHSLSLCYFLHQ